MKIFLVRIVAVWFLMCSVLVAQEVPPIEAYSSKMYGGESQNWGIEQSKENFIYVANNKGLLEFNGAEWQLYSSPNETIIRSVRVLDDLIYTGCTNDFGYWERNVLGVLDYTSLSQKLSIKFLEDEEFWGIIDIEDYILFQSFKRIYIYNKSDKTVSIIESETEIYKICKINESIYFQRIKDGIYRIENGAPKLVSDSPILQNNLLVNIFDNEGRLLIETEENGFYVLEDNTLTKWDIPGNETLSKTSVYRSERLEDGSFILGTRSDGIIHVTADGLIDYNINTINGLSNNTIHDVFEDAENNIWLALDNGINCINVKSPLRIYNDKEGKIGTVYASAIFKDYLYLGTNQGLYCKPLNSHEELRFIKGTQGPVRCLVEYDNTLFCGHNTGTFVVEKEIAKLCVDIPGTWNIIPIGDNKNLLLQGNYKGLHVIEKLNNIWTLKNKIEGFDISSKYFEIYNKNEIFVSHESKGVFKIKVNDSFTKATEVIKDSIIDKGLNSSLIKYQGDLLYAYKEGVFKYHESKNDFVKDTVLSELYTKKAYTSGKLIWDEEHNILWGFSKNNISFVSSGMLSSVPKVNKIGYSESLPRSLTGYENITHIDNNKHLIGTSTGYIVVDLDKLKNKEYEIIINSITQSDLKDNMNLINESIEMDFESMENNLEFTYSVAEFDKYFDTEYQYKLEGMYPEWSDWGANSHITFKNLPYGDYVFKVRAKVGNQLTKNTASYSFYIQRPWFWSNSAIVGYILLILLFSLFMHTLYKRYYRNQREKLMEKAAREIELKELENKQQLMRFNNEKLRQDIENKNRELGISTMSLIKKNEFLNNIKKELKQQAEEGKNLKHVIKIIDRNLNNTDDWHVFEEAFNNADKDFLKKIKSEHPALTSNDLRLCAYLRLNLSSKEIAPLLNISSRSVEVKRYRLRKKMGLAHESSLTDYILEI